MKTGNIFFNHGNTPPFPDSLIKPSYPRVPHSQKRFFGISSNMDHMTEMSQPGLITSHWNFDFKWLKRKKLLEA
jgi:hypothetical protein